MKPDSNRLERLNEVATAYIERAEFPGISWHINLHGQCINQGAVGYRDVAAKLPIELDTIHRIYSMTKPLVSVLCLKLVEEGVLRLMDPVSQWIDGFQNLKVLSGSGKEVDQHRPMTVEDLLTHRAGFSYDFLLDCPVASLYREQTLADNASRSLEEFVDVLSHLPLAHQPGEKWHYSVATDVLARVLEVATGQEFASLLRKRMLEPLNMIDTDFKVSELKQSRLASMYGLKHLGEADVPEGTQQTLKPMDIEIGYPVNSNSFARGGHGLYSTMADYLKFMAVLETGKTLEGEQVVSQPMFNMMWQNRLSAEQLPINIGENTYSGYGWNLFGRLMLDTGQANFLTGHHEGGWGGAATTYFWVDRTLGFSGIVMTQYLGSLKPLGNDMVSAAYQSLV